MDKIDFTDYFGVKPILDSAKQQLSSQFVDTNKVFSELNRVNKILNQVGGESFSEELGTLWEKCQDRTLNQQIDNLVDKSRDLTKHLVLDTAQHLKSTIKKLLQQNALTWENLQFIGLAKQLLAEAEGIFTKPLIKSTITTTLTSNDITEIASKLYEIAGSIYNKRINEGMRLIKKLQLEEQDTLKKHIEMLGGSYESLYIIDDSAKHEENCMLIIQGLLGMAKATAGLNDPYPTIEEIEDTFEDLERISLII